MSRTGRGGPSGASRHSLAARFRPPRSALECQGHSPAPASSRSVSRSDRWWPSFGAPAGASSLAGEPGQFTSPDRRPFGRLGARPNSCKRGYQVLLAGLAVSAGWLLSIGVFSRCSVLRLIVSGRRLFESSARLVFLWADGRTAPARWRPTSRWRAARETNPGSWLFRPA